MGREVDPNILAHGRDGHTGAEVVLRGLQRRFGQLAMETSVQSIVELLSFKLMSWESIDDTLGRFETVRATADTVDGFGLPVAALSWLVLEALQVPRSSWPLLLRNYGGHFPISEAHFEAMVTQIRQQHVIAEHTHAGPFSQTRGGPAPINHAMYADNAPQETYVSSTWGSGPIEMTGSSYDYAPNESEAFLSEDGWPACPHCQCYLYEGEGNDENDSDSEDEMEIVQGMSPDELQHYIGDIYDHDYESLLSEYLFAKRRFRTFAQKTPRWKRFPRHVWSSGLSKGKGRGRFRKGKGNGKGKDFLTSRKVRL